jgi:hypothetical protein
MGGLDCGGHEDLLFAGGGCSVVVCFAYFGVVFWGRSGALSTNRLGDWEKGQRDAGNDLCSSTKGRCFLAKDHFFVAEDRCQRASDLFFSAVALFPTAEALFLSAEDL